MVIVCIKQVPETRDVAVDEQTGVLLRRCGQHPQSLRSVRPRSGHPPEEQYGATVISMGPPQAEAVIREAYMMGADRGFLLTDRALAHRYLSHSLSLSRWD